MSAVSKSLCNISTQESPNKSTISGVASGRASEREDMQPARHMCSTKSLLCRHRTAKQWGGTGYKSRCLALANAGLTYICAQKITACCKYSKSISRSRIIPSNSDQRQNFQVVASRRGMCFSAIDAKKIGHEPIRLNTRDYVTVE